VSDTAAGEPDPAATVIVVAVNAAAAVVAATANTVAAMNSRRLTTSLGLHPRMSYDDRFPGPG
jgi:hypothetical protein